MPSSNPSVPKPSRRGFVAGGITLGAAAAAVVALPGHSTPDATAVEAPPSKPERGGGYHLSEHVKRYYKTTHL